MPIEPAILDAIDLITSLREGDTVAVTEGSRDLGRMTVSRGPRRCDGAYGSVESTRVTVTYGPGRYAFELSADAVGAGRYTVKRVSDGRCSTCHRDAHRANSRTGNHGHAFTL